jgi:hypothetical protein
MRQRFGFWAVLLIRLAASPFTAPFRTCGDPLVPDNTRPTASDADDNSRIGSPVERVLRRIVMPLAPLPTFGVPFAAEPVALITAPITRHDPSRSSSPSTVLRI